MNIEELGAILKSLRGETGISKYNLEKRGMNFLVATALEEGSRGCQISNLLKYCQLTGIDIKLEFPETDIFMIKNDTSLAEIGGFLRECRLKKNLTAYKIEKQGMHRSITAAIEKGTRGYSTIFFLRYCQFVGIDIKLILSEK